MAKEVAQEQPRPTAPRTVRCIVKLGGAAITNKGELESINEENLRLACAQLRHAMSEANGDGAMEKVTSLNQEIVRALAREGIPSVGMSSFACGWSTHQRKLASTNASQIIQPFHAGFVLVLHGDAVLDELLDCTILSGDVIITNLAQLLSPKYVVFWYCYLSSFTALKVFCYQWKMVLYTITVFFNCLYRLPWDTENVHGVYDRPPTDSNAVLLRGI
ncbi:Amino acid kinase family protein, partial [Zea mays]